MAMRISTRFTSAVSTRDLYSTLLTWETFTLVTVSMGHGKAQPQPSLRTSVKRPKRCTTPLLEASTCTPPATTPSNTSTPPSSNPKLPDDPPTSEAPPEPSPAPAPP